MRSTPRSRRVTAVAALAVPALLLTACGSDSKSDSKDSSSGSSSAAASSSGSASSNAANASSAITPAPKGDLAGITVGGTKDAPTVTLDKKTYSAKETTVKTVTEGTGEAIAADDTIVTNVVLVGGKSGKKLVDTFEKKTPDQWSIKSVIPGLAQGVVGQKAGSRVLVAIAPKDAAALIAKGNPSAGVAADETIVALIDIVKKGMLGEPCKFVTTKDGLPEVTAPEGKAATIKPAAGEGPKVSTAYVLKQGTGETVKAGDKLSAQYTGLLWKDGKKFDSSFDRGAAPTEFPIGVGGVIKAWDKCLVGQKVGTQLMIVAPPAEAYGDQGQPPTIPAKSTLVFVVNIAGTKAGQ